MNFPSKIKTISSHPFTISKAGLYYFAISAKCLAASQLGIKAKVDENLRFTLDGFPFREVPNTKTLKFYNNAASWNGTDQQGHEKIVCVLSFLEAGKHEIKFYPKPSAEIINFFGPYEITDLKNININLTIKATEFNRNPLITFVLRSLPLKQIKPDVLVKWHLKDGDDMKLYVDGKVQLNTDKKVKLHQQWRWHSFPGVDYINPQIFNLDFPVGIHYLDFWADKSPILNNLTVDLGTDNIERIPSLIDPVWLKDFKNDSDQIMLARVLFGEARDERISNKARIGILWVIKNRKDTTITKRWPKTYKEVILDPDQFSCFNLGEPNRPYVENPFIEPNIANFRSWENCYKVAGEFLAGKYPDPTNGSYFYLDISAKRKPKEYLIKIDKFMFYGL